MHYDWSILVETVLNTVSTLLCRRNDINVKNHDTMAGKIRRMYGENYAQEHTRKSGAYLRVKRNTGTFAAEKYKRRLLTLVLYRQNINR